MFSNAVFAEDDHSKAENIILNVLRNREFYGNYIEEYEATVYVKGNSFTKKRNFLHRYAPDFLYLDKKGESNFVESIVDINFKAPSHFNQKITAVNGSKIYSVDIQERVMQFLNINIYSPAIFNDQVLLPGEKDVLKYYSFKYISETDTLNYKIHKIEVRPKIRSQKLIAGYFYIVDGLWTVYKFEIRGRWEFSKYWVETEFGLPEDNFRLLPLQTKITFDLRLLGNETINHYFSSYDYKKIEKRDDELVDRKINYDLTDYYTIQVDSVPVLKDEEFWEENRKVPLTGYEEHLIQLSKEREKNKDTLDINKLSSINLVKGTIVPRRFIYNNSQFSYSGLVNPFKLAYSKLDGLVYWQQFRIKTSFKNSHELSFSPNIGFLFQKKEIYFRTPVNWVFQPRRFGEINLNFGNRNQTYNFKTQDFINEEMPDSIDFEDLDLEYFRHFYTSVEGQYEITNGLILYAGINYDWYIPVKSSDSANDFNLRIDVGEDVEDIIEDRYRNFSPIVGLTWTPGQYYRFTKKRKEYIKSKYPTFSFEYGRGIPGIIESNSDYERIEADIQQKIPLDLLRSFQYYFGGGTFTNTKSFYFADFSLFQKRNIPQSWDDPIGGVFHLLSGQWYNASDSYIQAHFMYESPFIILHLFRGVNLDVLKERFYFSQLYTPALPCYTELGYGVGNFIGNAGLFVSLNKGKFESVGIKFAFELGR